VFCETKKKRVEKKQAMTTNLPWSNVENLTTYNHNHNHIISKHHTLLVMSAGEVNGDLTLDDEKMLTSLFEQTNRLGVCLDGDVVQSYFEEDRRSSVKRSWDEMLQLKGVSTPSCSPYLYDIADMRSEKPTGWRPPLFLNECGTICWLNAVMHVITP
jgi:hypothetical protein